MTVTARLFDAKSFLKSYLCDTSMICLFELSVIILTQLHMWKLYLQTKEPRVGPNFKKERSYNCRHCKSAFEDGKVSLKLRFKLCCHSFINWKESFIISLSPIFLLRRVKDEKKAKKPLPLGTHKNHRNCIFFNYQRCLDCIQITVKIYSVIKTVGSLCKVKNFAIKSLIKHFALNLTVSWVQIFLDAMGMFIF